MAWYEFFCLACVCLTCFLNSFQIAGIIRRLNKLEKGL